MNTLLHGSYFAYNFGDTLLCRLFADWTRAGDPQGTISTPLANERNRQLIGADERGLQTIPGAERLVLCGGGYLGEPGSGQRLWTVRAYKRHMLLINWCVGRIPVQVLATGVGPLSSARMRKDVASLFDHAIAPVVRDDASAQYLHDWGVRNPVEVKVDAVVTASREDLLSGLGQVPASLSLAKSGYDGLIGVHTEVRPSGDDLELARGLVDWILKNTRYAVALISDGQRAVKSRAWHKDVQIDEAHKNRVVPLLYSGEPGDMIAILNDLDLVVTTKLHVGIVRCALGKSVIAAPKHSKTPRFYEQMGLADWCVPHGATDRLGRTVALLQAWLAGKRPSFAKFEQRRSVGFYRDRLAKTVEGRALS